MKTGKRFLSIFLVVLMLLTAAPLAGFVGLGIAPKAKALAATGQCGENVYWSFNESIGALTISGTGSMTNYTVGSSPFNLEIRSIAIENGVTTIGENAFSMCAYLSSITLSNSVINIGKSAFDGCTSLTSVTIPDSVTKIESLAFSYCSSLKSVIIGNNVTSIGSSAFYHCSSLSSVTFPDSVTSIGQSAFSGCTSLTSVTIPSSIRSVGMYAFSYCNSLMKVTLLDGITNIVWGEFANCTSLTDVVIPDSVTSIEGFAFYQCNALTEVELPNGITSIGDSAFEDCIGLTRLTIPGNVESIGYCASCNCSNLESLTIKNGVKEIDFGAFQTCSRLTNVTIPSSVVHISDFAFASCNDLEDVYYSGTEEQWSRITIGSNNECLTTATIHFNSTGEEPPVEVPVEGISLNTDQLVLTMGTRESLVATITPANATNKSITWSSSDPTVANVNGNGLIITEGEGFATITATTVDGEFSATCKVNVISGEETEITITVQNKNGGNIGRDAVVVLYDKNGKYLTSDQTDSRGICVFSRAQCSNAKSIVAYKDTEIKGGSNRAAARSSFNNVLYSFRTTSDYITSSGKWSRTPFDGTHSMTLKLSNAKIILNCSVSYYYDDKTEDYYEDIVKAFKYVNQYLQEATDGYIELNSVAIFSTTDKNAFYKKNSAVAKCDIQIRQYASEKWGSKIWPNSHVNGAFNDTWQNQKGEYYRIQMQKKSAGIDISDNPSVWAKIVVHELGHYFMGFKDEYLNYKGQKWRDIGRPNGAPENYGLMENQYTDLEMSVPMDYTNVSNLSNRFWTAQYYKHEMSCWEYFDNVFFSSRGYHVSMPLIDREYEEVSNNLWFFNCRSAQSVKAPRAAKQAEKDTSLFVLTYFRDGKIFLQTDEEICSCTLSDFGCEKIDQIQLEKVTDGYQIPLTAIDEGKNLLTVESANGINSFDIYSIQMTDTSDFSNRNNSIMIWSDSEQNCRLINYNNYPESISEGSLCKVVALDVDEEYNVTLNGRAEIDGVIDYSTLSWYKLENNEWIKIVSETSIGEYESLETSCSVSESGVYALMATPKTAEVPSLPTCQTFFSANSIDSRDGGIGIKIDYQNKDIMGYRILCQAKDQTETITLISQETELSFKTGSPNQDYEVKIWAILYNGAEVVLGKTQTVTSGEYYQEGSRIPFWWVVKYDLQDYENEIVDDKDNDADGFTNYQEYLNKTNPIEANEPTTHTHDYTATVTTPATCTEPGETTYTCVDGDDTYTETIPALGHTDDNNDGRCDVCGEQMTGGDHCKFCGKIHNGGFFDKLTGFFHKIFAIFKR